MMEKSFKNQDFHGDFVGSVYELWRNGKLCDSSIEVGSRVFKFHKIVLAVSSPEILNMDENRLVIQLPVETDISALEAVLQYVYGGELKLTQSTVHSVQKLASMFKINKVLEFCKTYQSELSENTGSLKTEVVSRKRKKCDKERKCGKRSCRLKSGQKASRRSGHGKKMPNILPMEPLHVNCMDMGMESSCVLPKKETLQPKGRGKCRGMNSRGKLNAASLLSSCRLISKCKSESSLEGKKDLEFTTLNDSLRKSPRTRKAKTKLQSDTFSSVVKLEYDNNSQISGQTDKQDLKEELDSVCATSKDNSSKHKKKIGKRRPLTRAEIQRSYRARKFEKMSAEELEAFKIKERERVRRHCSKSTLSVNQGKGKGKKKEASKKGRGHSKVRVKIEVETIKPEPTLSKLEGQDSDKKNKKRNNCQKRYRDRKKSDPEWRKKEAERARKRYIPISQLTKKEQKLRRMRESERTRLWRMKKKLQTSSVSLVQESQNTNMADISGKSFIERNMHESFCGEGGHDIGGNNELLDPDHADACMVNSIIHSLNDQFQYMLVGDGNDASDIVKKEAVDPEENVAFIESVTRESSFGNHLHLNVDKHETGLCNSELDEVGKGDLGTGDDCVSNFHIKTEDGEVIVCEADHESVGDVSYNDDDDNCIDNDDCNDNSACIDNDTHVEKEEQDVVSGERNHENPGNIIVDKHFLIQESNINLNQNEQVMESREEHLDRGDDDDDNDDDGSDSVQNVTDVVTGEHITVSREIDHQIRVDTFVNKDFLIQEGNVDFKQNEEMIKTEEANVDRCEDDDDVIDKSTESCTLATGIQSLDHQSGKS